MKRYKSSNPLPSQQSIDKISKVLASQIGKEIFHKKYAKVANVLKFVSLGLFLGSSFVVPNLPKALTPYFKPHEQNAWKRFNIPYLKRTLKRLEKQELVETNFENGFQTIKITQAGKLKILRFALYELGVEKPKIWDRTWWLVSYDLPKGLERERDILRNYLKIWGFYPLHESVFLHAYSCDKQIEFLREYLNIAEHVRFFRVSRIENDNLFREFFGV